MRDLEDMSRLELIGQIMYLRKRVSQLEDEVSEMGWRERCGLALYRPWKTTAECLHRKLQWQPARRTAERRNLRHVG